MSALENTGGPPRPPSPGAAALDVLVVVVAMVAVKRALLPVTLVFAGPASLVVAMALATWALWRRGDRWYDLGLRRPRSPAKTLLGGVVVAAGILGSVALSAPIATELLGIEKVADAGAGRFGALEGNLPLLLLWLALSWVHAGFNEEMIYRAFLLTRLEEVFRGFGVETVGWVAPVLGVAFAAAFFGYRHMYYQGWYGFVTTGAVGVFLGVVYLRWGRRNVWPLVVGHALLDSLGMVLRYLGVDG